MSFGLGIGRLPLAAPEALLLSLALGPTAAAVDFAHDVVPLFKKHCGECHVGDAKQGGFLMTTREDLLAGGDSGVPGFVSGKAAASEIVRRITGRKGSSLGFSRCFACRYLGGSS